MPEVDFYILSEMGDTAVLRTACRVAEKAWSQGLRVHVLARDEDEASRFDDLLWTLRQESFVPHERWDGTGSPGARVTVGAVATLALTPDILVNLGAPIPGWYAGCQRIAEIVGGDEGPKADGRRRYREYRDAGVELRTHEVSA